MEAKLYLTAFRFDDDPPEEVKIIDTIEHDGKIFMVLSWWDYDDGLSEPDELVELSDRKYRQVSFAELGYHFECSEEPLPKALLTAPDPDRARASEAVHLNLRIRNRKTYRHI